jgi:glycosyltransferase involved in cell wall biosynthesis
MERIPILFLIDVLYTSRGGAEGVLQKMIVHLPRDRYDCSIATFATHAERVAAEQYPCPVYRLPIQRTYDWRALRMGSRLAGLIRSQRIQIVHTFFPAADLFGGAIARLSGCPIVISSRRDMGFQRSAAQRLVYRAAGGWLFDQVHAVAEHARRWHIEQDRLDPKNVFTVYNGIDLNEVDAARQGSDGIVRRLDGPLVVCVANIRPVKGIDDLVRAAAMVCRANPSARFLVVGAVQDTGYMEQVAELARMLGVDRNVIFAGASDAVPPILKASHVFFMPSRSEGLCNAILEAMACELPCVATETGGNPELIQEGWNGYLTPVGDYEAAARRILELLSDPETAHAMGRVGRRIVESQFSLQAMIDNLTGHYEDLLERRATRLRSESLNHPVCAE